MNLIKITGLTNQFGLTSRSLRYYEQAGLIESVRPQFEKYRFYDEENVERLKQIIVLRKMQISIKDIIRIYKSDDMSVVVQTFVDRIPVLRSMSTKNCLRNIQRRRMPSFDRLLSKMAMRS
jgi:DNA-binding transcriptional MerR regulator